MSSPNKVREKKFFSLAILYLWIKKIARGILWVAWVASFSYRQLIIQRVKDITARYIISFLYCSVFRQIQEDDGYILFV